VTHELFSAGKEELQYAIANNTFFEDVPTCTVVGGAKGVTNIHAMPILVSG